MAARVRERSRGRRIATSLAVTFVNVLSSGADSAIAFVGEPELAKHRRERFTVGY